MQSAQPKVSLITPCYNGESHINHFFEGLLAQDYHNVEFIFINDGSTDKTEELFLSYKPKLEAKGWQVIYISQANAGQAAAVNQGLKIFSGDYVFFPDSDDIMYPTNISAKVSFMQANPEYGWAYCVVDAVSEKDINRVLYKMDNSAGADDFFNNLLKRRNISVWGSVSNIIRSSALLSAIPSRQIYAGQKAQNIQLLLPVAQISRGGVIAKSLGKIVVRADSHSHTTQSLADRQEELTDIYLHTILNLNDTAGNKTRYISQVFKNLPTETELNQNTSTTVYLAKIPFIKIKRKLTKTKVYILGIPLFTIK